MFVRCRSFLVLVVLIVGFSMAAEARVTVISVSGDAKVIRQGSSVGRKCSLGTVIRPGDWLSAGAGSHILLSFDRENLNTIRIGPNSLAMKSERSAPERVEIFDGELIARLDGLARGESFKIRTPTATCGARGTAWHILASGTSTEISVLEHEVYLIPLGPDGTELDVEYTISEGFARSVRKGEMPSEMYGVGEKRMEELNSTMSDLLQNITTGAQVSHHRLTSSPRENKSGMTRSGIVMVDGVGVSREMYEQINAWRKDTRARADEPSEGQ